MYKPQWLSRPAEILLHEWEWNPPAPYDVVIVGSGYGGAVAAAKLTALQDDKGKALRVCLLERGQEHVPGTFPNNFSELPGHVRFNRFDDPVTGGVQDGLFDLRIGKDVSVLLANGLGGGSLINAGVAEKPSPEVFQKGWPEAIRRDDLSDYYKTAAEMLRANPARIDGIAKHRQFQNLAGNLNPQPANVTVAFESHHGIQEGECVACGDCATGCNVGAKYTLSKTYLAQAWRQGAEIYTGATVSHVQKDNGSWSVFVALTTPSRPLQEKSLREIRARHVILAAGTLGSTEILMRSKERNQLSLSERLGERFSTNGDMISVLYKSGENVNAVANETKPLDQRKVGPTITGVARNGGTPSDPIVIEELAVPGALRRVFEEIVTTAAMLDGLARCDLKTHLPPAEGNGTDPAAVDPRVINGCQLFAAMGNDGANGTLQLVPGWNDAAVADRVQGGAIRIHWPDVGKAKVFQVQEETFRRIAKEKGWTYLPSPAWQPFPAVLSGSLSGEKPSGLVFSVHPLGGCGMADRAEDGVVDHMGRVFRGTTGNEVHEGLLVLDGSIIPRALGINPLLTITALAERALEHYSRNRHWIAKEQPEIHPEVPPLQVVARRPAAPPVTAVKLSERMTGSLRVHPRGRPQDAELTIDFENVADLAGFLRSPRHLLKFVGALRFFDRETGGNIARSDVQGSAQLLVRAESTWVERVATSLWTYARSRALPDIFSAATSWPTLTGLLDVPGWFRWAGGMLALASNVGEVRHFLYEFTLQRDIKDAAGNVLRAGTTFKGRKTLEYTYGGNPWRQLVDLDLTACPTREPSFRAGMLSVDVSYFFRGFESPLQITRQRDLPAAWMDLASLGLFFARVILKIHFWSFRLPQYQKYDPMRDARRLPGPLDPLHMDRHVLRPETPGEVFLLLTRYRRDKDRPGKPVLLIHGLGSGGVQFATARVNPNLVQHLAAQDFDVWVAELRTSIALPSSVHQWTLDQVARGDDTARGDVPRLVDFVLKNTGEHQLDVVAHCIGSAMFCTAVLDGKLQHAPEESKIRSAVLMQVGPLVILSKGTKLRALAAAPLTRLLPDGFVDFSVDDRADWVQSVVDRLLNTYPYPPDEARHHRLGWFDDDHIANCNRWAGIDGMMIRHENLSPEMLEHLGEILGHSSLTIWAQPIQYGLLGRLTDSEGANSYVTPENIRNYFKFPVRFLHGEDNDVFHPLTSQRSCELLRRTHGDDFPTDVIVLEGYRHLDPLIGRNAGFCVFPKISEFLKAEHRAPEHRDHVKVHYYFRRPLIGPVLGWLRHDEKHGTWWVRVWCRLDDLRSPASSAVVTVWRGLDRVGLIHVPCPSEPTPGKPLTFLKPGAMDTLLCLDVELGKDPGPYNILVLSAHEDRTKSVRPEQQKAELTAGKRASVPTADSLLIEAGESLEQKLHGRRALEDWLKLAGGPPLDGGDDEKTDHATVQVPKERVTEQLTIALASCRYPGWVFDRRRADETFGGLARRIELAEHAAPDEIPAPSALFLVGDQIYADATAGVFDPKTRRERFYEAYREAWTAPNARRVLSQLPAYMMMDDHEAGDNWHPEDFVSEVEGKLRGEGVKAFRQYQWLHSPGNGRELPPQGEAFWYDFTLQGFPVFVCDTRSGRSGRERILDPLQFDALLAWLHHQQQAIGERPKFVVSPSVVLPFRKPLDAKNGRAEFPTHSDGWDGFPDQLVELFSFIARELITNVVFLCGDAHLSMHSEICFEDTTGQLRPLRAWCVVGSPMYAPYPFVNATPDDFVCDTSSCRLSLPGVGAMHYKVMAGATSESFTIVTATKNLAGRWDIITNMTGYAAPSPGHRPLAPVASPFAVP